MIRARLVQCKEEEIRMHAVNYVYGIYGIAVDKPESGHR